MAPDPEDTQNTTNAPYPKQLIRVPVPQSTEDITTAPVGSSTTEKVTTQEEDASARNYATTVVDAAFDPGREADYTLHAAAPEPAEVPVEPNTTFDPDAAPQEDEEGPENDPNSQDSVPWSQTFSNCFQKVLSVASSAYTWADEQRKNPLSCFAAGLGLGALGVYTTLGASRSGGHDSRDTVDVLNLLAGQMYRAEQSDAAILRAIESNGTRLSV